MSDDQGLTVAEYLEEWMAVQRSRLQPATWHSYRNYVDNHILPAFGDTPLVALTAAALSKFYAWLQQDGGKRGRPLSLRTVAYCHGVIHKALNDAVRLEILPRNVAVNATLPKIELRGDGVREIGAWSAEELRTFLSSTQGTPHHSLWLLAATTGLRRGELLGLRWDDVDFAGRAIVVRRALSVVKGDARLKQPKTSRCRTLRIDNVTLAMLARRHRDQARQREVAGDRWNNPWNLVFTGSDGSHLDPMQITHAFRVAVAKAPVSRRRLHDMRHTHATLLLQAGVPVKVVSERLGHATISLTLDIYAHVLPAMDADAAERFAAQVFG